MLDFTEERIKMLKSLIEFHKAEIEALEEKIKEISGEKDGLKPEHK